jgi:hypothetical protein
MHLPELESLYDQFAPAGYAFALQLTRDADAAEDLVQSVFLRLARRSRFTILNPRSFVLRCIYRAHVDVVRRDATRRQMRENFAWEAQTVFRTCIFLQLRTISSRRELRRVRREGWWSWSYFVQRFQKCLRLATFGRPTFNTLLIPCSLKHCSNTNAPCGLLILNCISSS